MIMYFFSGLALGLDGMHGCRTVFVMAAEDCGLVNVSVAESNL